MSIGLSKTQITKQLNAALLEKLAHVTGVLPYEEVTEVVAEIITTNNTLIEKEIQDQIRRLRNDLRI